MTMFGKENANPTRLEPRGSGAIAEAPMSIISSGMKITGDLECAGVVKIDGRIDGSVTGARQVLLGRGGAVHGNVVADEVVIGGVVDGAILAGERLELQGSAVVNGDIETKSIVVMEGARINGVVRMTDSNVSVRTGRPEPLRIATGA
jgi:cytoskeletal protein CcmA (bactofilin family)